MVCMILNHSSSYCNDRRSKKKDWFHKKIREEEEKKKTRNKAYFYSCDSLKLWNGLVLRKSTLHIVHIDPCCMITSSQLCKHVVGGQA